MKRFLLFFALTCSLLADTPAAKTPDLPPKKPVLGVKKLACIAVQWTNDQRVNETNCGNMAEAVKSFYERNSRGKVTFPKTIGTVQMGIANSAKEVNPGTVAAVNKFPNLDYYIVPNLMNPEGDHSGDKIAYLSQILNTVAEHETGHLLSLGHTTRLDVPGACCDKGSIMNPDAKPSNFLTAPQYYWLGWMTADEYVTYTAAGTFVLKHPLNVSAGTAAVIVSPTAMGHPADSRWAFVSYAPLCDSGNPCVVIHLANQGGSELVKEIGIGTSYHDTAHTGLDVAVVAGATPANVSITVSIH